METKFLSDGRKVAIIGQLNNQEAIVQEVFVTDQGDEIPSGERFTAKSLHDAPVKSYKTKEEERLEKRIQQKKDEISRLEKRAGAAHIDAKAHEDIGKFVRAVAKGLSQEDLKMLTAYLAGEIRWLVADDIGFKPPVAFDDEMKDTDSWSGIVKYDGLKLLSLYGRTDGALTYNLHRHPDGSGSRCEVFGFATFEDAARKSINIAMGKLGSSFGASDMAASVLRSSVADYLTDDERKKLRGVIESGIEKLRYNQQKRVAEQAERYTKELAKLESLLLA